MAKPEQAEKKHQAAILAAGQQEYELANQLLAQAIKLDPNNPILYSNFGVILTRQGFFDEAKNKFLQAIDIDQNYFDAYYNFAQMLQTKDEYMLAKKYYEKAIQLNPHHTKCLMNLSSVYQSLGDYIAAIPLLEHAIELKPTCYDQYYNLGNAYLALRELPTADQYFQQAIKLKPEYANAHHNLSVSLLHQQRFEEAYHEHEWRFRSDLDDVKMPELDCPYLNDQVELQGKNIFIWFEQGLGDLLMHFRFILQLSTIVEHCYLSCPPRMLGLLEANISNHKNITIFSNELEYQAYLQDKKIDYHCAMASLAYYLGETNAAKLSAPAYLDVDQHKVQELRDKYLAIDDGLDFAKATPGKLLVGIAWQTSAKYQAEARTTELLAQWSALLANKNCQFVNLQYGEVQAQLDNVKTKLGVDVINDQSINALGDLLPYAAQVAAMDLIISIDNTAVHFAGALGVPVWTLLPFRSEARWGTVKQHTHWYDSMRLYQQQIEGDWQTVFKKVNAALETWINEQRQAT